jgi:uncharacterized protein YkwD
MLIAPSPARAQTCELLNQLGVCSPSESGVTYHPDGTISLPGGGGTAAPSLPPAPSVPTLLPGAASHLLDLANQERARVGAPKLTFRDDVVKMATVHTQKMLGSGGGIFHNLDLLTQPLRNVLGAVAVGENVGWSTHLEDLHPRLMASPGHRAALLDPRFTVAGFAVMQDTDGLYYVTQNFVQPSGATPPPSPPASSVPDDATPAPASAPVRVSAPVPAEETAAQTVAGTPAESPANAVPTAVVEPTDAVVTDQRMPTGSEVAVGEVAGLISGDLASTSAGARSGPMALALALLAIALAGQGWTWTRSRQGLQH